MGVDLLAGGSRWDPPGLEGSTAAALLAGARAHALTAELGRDRSRLWLRCDREPEACAERLVAALRDPAPPLAVDDYERRAPTLVDHALRAVFEGHPYQHAPAGGLGSRGAVRAHHVDAARERLSVRSAVRGFASDPTSAQALRAALSSLPPGPPPDPAMMGPARPEGAQLIVLRTPEETYGYAIAGAAPRSALTETRLEPTADAPDGTHASACAHELLRTAGIARSPVALAPALDHAAVVVAAESADRLEVEQVVAELPHAWPLLRVDAVRRCPELAPLLHAAWPERALTILVRWPETIEDPWAADVPPAGYDTIHSPQAPE